MDEAGEVKDVGPEEDPARRADTQWETEQPLERGLEAAPEPSGLADFSCGGEEDPSEYGGRDQGHGEGVDGGEGTQRHGAAAADQAEEDVEGEGEEDVGGNGCEEEWPSGAP
ncbi:hypothetical protein Nepgr_016579 [Nepenthes gracilis]|uniref:Uncharacterized protein n=1 Tax=Nepenthes gracilis TaxID=150966 RepID=A0AAD3SNV6_NEPGR|nr:hypothetical protein Nepgr_016579 [Nepenthes gracilis]